jgi:succinate dehydrogenase/fumarate reductase flavoprotein subunit
MKNEFVLAFNEVLEEKGLPQEVVIEALQAALAAPGLTVAELELFNMLTVARQIVATALLREESRGVHLRSDFPERDDAQWRRHSLVHRDAGTGELVVGVSGPETSPWPCV